jgi:fructose-bisphosphate aldolase class II
MPLVTLSDVLRPALYARSAVAGLVVLGWEDAVAYVLAAEQLGVPIILQAGPGARAHTPLPVLASMFRHLAEQAKVPVVAHLDHGKTPQECFEAIDCGFSSVMYDGSALPISENTRNTRLVVERAHSLGISVEAELGVVGYVGGNASQSTDPSEAAQFSQETQVDALAVSVGNIHLSQKSNVPINIETLAEISAATSLPLVLHGGSGIPFEQRAQIARKTSVCKFNIGTELRQAFGASLRDVLAKDPAAFDRIEILNSVIPELALVAKGCIQSLSGKVS